MSKYSDKVKRRAIVAAKVDEAVDKAVRKFKAKRHADDCARRADDCARALRRDAVEREEAARAARYNARRADAKFERRREVEKLTNPEIVEYARDLAETNERKRPKVSAVLRELSRRFVLSLGLSAEFEKIMLEAVA